MAAIDAKEADYYCTVEGCGRDLETVECDLVPTGQHQGAVSDIRVLRAALIAVRDTAHDDERARTVDEALSTVKRGQ